MNRRPPARTASSPCRARRRAGGIRNETSRPLDDGGDDDVVADGELVVDCERGGVFGIEPPHRTTDGLERRLGGSESASSLGRRSSSRMRINSTLAAYACSLTSQGGMDHCTAGMKVLTCAQRIMSSVSGVFRSNTRCRR